jgi:hypothetical protein
MANASTWIGNGGSIMDTELRSTLQHLKAAARDVPDHADELCTCQGTSDQCALLKDLSPDRMDFCGDFILAMNGRLLKLLDGNVKYRWSSENLKTSKGSRDFDAIAQPGNNQIVINEARFARMKTADRIQLLAHELLHLLDYKGRRLTDEEPLGAFSTEQGGRQLLDSVGAAYVIVAMQEGYIPLHEQNLSRPFRNIFLWGMSGSRFADSALKSDAFFDEYWIQGSAWGVTFYPRVTDNLGWTLAYYDFHDTQSAGKIRGKIHQYLTEAGPEYRLVPFSTGKPFLDSIQISAHIGLGYGRVRHDISDDYVQLNEVKSSWAGIGNVRLHVPLIYDFWLMVESGFAYMPYELKNIGISNKTISQQNFVGVSYGFQY